MAVGECQVCGSGPFLVHNVPHHGVFADLCTACLLRHKRDTFCPVCFDIHDDTAAAGARIMCLRCPALAHLTCLPSSHSNRYLCPHCSDPSFSFIDSTTALVFTKESLCAAKIAAAAMHRAAALARADAEQKVMGALLARRNAKEAIERVASLMSNQNHSDVI
ncbi:uncharacterized protein LOC121767433 [Salvia splendens]|uniref:uncharacterized protein LOC121767433 n=1 Tax=Salvia splendens TaxID=180675 RepID=UPI001C260927|nr:uncharacterized protein LOC121767433 [Salvia splendens]